MGVVSPYLSDNEVISHLRQEFDRDEQYRINFHYWLSTAHHVKDGVLISVGSRRFLLDPYTGTVIREILGGDCTC